MPAAAVTPTLKVYVKVVAVKTLVVGCRQARGAGLFGPRTPRGPAGCYFEQNLVFKACRINRMKVIAWDNRMTRCVILSGF